MFPRLITEKIVQTNDRTRLDASKSFGFDSIDLIEIRPEAGADFVTVDGRDTDAFLDWSYDVAGDKEVTLKITSGATSKEITASIKVVTAAEDALFSDDSDLLDYESAIFDNLAESRSSFLDKHRAAKKEILQVLDENGVRDFENKKITDIAIIDRDALCKWSTFIALSLIFEWQMERDDDLASIKAKRYREWAQGAASNVVLRLDTDKDGIEDTETKPFSIGSCDVVVR